MTETEPGPAEGGAAIQGEIDVETDAATDGGTVPGSPASTDRGPTGPEEAEGVLDRGEPITVLHVDDDPQVGDIVATFLERGSDVRVLTESDAGTALDRVADGDVDCVVTDVEMPGMDGLELASAVEGRHPEVPVILFSSRPREEVAGADGVAGHVRKSGTPQRFELLERRVRSMLA